MALAEIIKVMSEAPAQTMKRTFDIEYAERKGKRRKLKKNEIEEAAAPDKKWSKKVPIKRPC